MPWTKPLARATRLGPLLAVDPSQNLDLTTRLPSLVGAMGTSSSVTAASNGGLFRRLRQIACRVFRPLPYCTEGLSGHYYQINQPDPFHCRTPRAESDTNEQKTSLWPLCMHDLNAAAIYCCHPAQVQKGRSGIRCRTCMFRLPREDQHSGPPSLERWI